MEELKASIIEMAKGEMRKVEIRAITEQKAKERAERDAAIAAKKKVEGTTDEQDERLAAGLKSNTELEESSWVRGGAVVKTESPMKPMRERRPMGGDEGMGFLERSNKPRAAPEE